MAMYAWEMLEKPRRKRKHKLHMHTQTQWTHLIHQSIADFSKPVLSNALLYGTPKASAANGKCVLVWAHVYWTVCWHAAMCCECVCERKREEGSVTDKEREREGMGDKGRKRMSSGEKKERRERKGNSRETEKQASLACVLVPSPVRALSACDLWHRDWEQSSLPAQYCYNWQLMRPDGLSSTALNRGLHLHESRALLFLFSPLFLPPIYFFFQGGSSVASYHKISGGAEGK